MKFSLFKKELSAKDLYIKGLNLLLEGKKEEALQFFASERTRLMQLSREDAIKEVLKLSKITNKIRVIKSVSDNGLLNVG